VTANTSGTITCDGQTIADFSGLGDLGGSPTHLTGTLTVTGALSGVTIDSGTFQAGSTGDNVTVSGGSVTATSFSGTINNGNVRADNASNATVSGGVLNVDTLQGGGASMAEP
jgi:hypothetical protein